MKLSQLIKSKRIAKDLTQKEVGDRLGISGAAVNKWEQGKTYPDITLLSPLARLLETDLNTLLAFHENLTEAEIHERLKTLRDCFDTEGLEAAFEKGRGYIQEFPKSEQLIFGVAQLFEGFSSAADVSEDAYPKEILSLYESIATSSQEELRWQVIDRLFHLYLNEGDFVEAERLLAELPTNVPDVKFLQALFASKQENYESSSQQLERNLLSLLNILQQHLSLLVVNALATENVALAHEYVTAASGLTTAFQLWDYNQYTLPLDIALAQKDQAETIRLIQALLKASENPWHLSETTLYPHLPVKEQTITPAFLKNMIRDSFLGNPDLEFVEALPEFQALFHHEEEAN